MMQTDQSDFDFTVVERPKFLKVLCILTFICSAWIIMTNAFTFFTAKEMSKGIAEAKLEIAREINQEKDKDEPVLIFAKKIVKAMSEAFTEDNIRYNALGIIIAQLFCLLGAILMWNLKKKGYYLYIL